MILLIENLIKSYELSPQENTFRGMLMRQQFKQNVYMHTHLNKFFYSFSGSLDYQRTMHGHLNPQAT